ncbi:hypothetical protein [Burkholderia lata]|uniref:hypothetical protein n=1 Tax=Burkholderia lata (strain ATCC 17760 / DSM 23089 / LMG 22485 / NCIMB 9086 / R18194 / 383) TaxID=482957 RepID=UPI0015838219|nr:hypothetical protein [Burkholderia lata]
MMLITTRHVGTKEMKIFRRHKVNYFAKNFDITPHPKTNATRRAINPLNLISLKIFSSVTLAIFIPKTILRYAAHILLARTKPATRSVKISIKYAMTAERTNEQKRSG